MVEVIIKTVAYSEQIQAINNIRTQVFQVEQGIAQELEFDGLDQNAIHLLAYLDNQPVGTARIRKIDDQTAKIERLSVLSLARRKGIGKKIMVTAIEVAISQNYHIVVVNAQKYIKTLYQELGFEQVGNVFEEANIPHIKMTKKLNNDNKNSLTEQNATVIEKSPSNDSETINDQPQFQAVGIIKAEVKFHDDEKKSISITIGNKKYGMECSKRNYDARTGLKKEIERTGKTTQRLIVYPKVMHFPKKEQPLRLWFQLVGFVREDSAMGIAKDLADNEFKLCGLWQFIPVCRQPCISIFLNFKQERLDFLKKSEEPAKNAKFMKASHIPVLWKDSPQRPFRFNPRGNKDQGHPYFVQIKAAFLPHRDAFGFVEELSEPIEQAPKFMKLPKPPKPQGKKKSSSKPKINQQKKPKKLILKAQK